MALAQKGIDVRQTGTSILFRAFLQTSAGALLGTGTTVLSIQELQSDGTIKSYDFNDNTFKTTALTTPTLAMTHRPSNNAATTTGLWTVALNTVSGFTAGGIYTAIVNNSGASPTDQMREFQYGGAQGDMVVTANGTGVGEINIDMKMIDGQLTSGNNATLNLKQLNIVNSAGDAIVGTSSGSNGNGMNLSGNGSGNGLKSTGGATGRGGNFLGGATSGAGLRCEGQGAGASGIHGLGFGALGVGFRMEGGTTGAGLKILGGTVSGNGIDVTTVSGHGVSIAPLGASAHGMLIAGGDSGTSDGLKLVAGTGGVGFRLDTLTASGAVNLSSTLTIAGATSLQALSLTTLTASGAVSFQSTFATTGTTTFNAFTVTNALTVSGTTTLTGAVSAIHASNDIRGILLQAAQTTNITGNITGNLSGSVGSVTGAVGSVTGAVGSVAGNVGGNVVGSVGSVTASVTVGTNNDKTGYSLTAAGLDAVLIESGISASASLTNDSGAQLTSINLRQAMALILSSPTAGVLAGAGTATITTKPAGLPSGNTRVSASVSSGNRTALTLKVPT